MLQKSMYSVIPFMYIFCLFYFGIIIGSQKFQQGSVRFNVPMAWIPSTEILYVHIVHY